MPANPIPLSSLRIDKPCSQNWQSMRGDDRRRFCAQCQHHVHNLSALTEREIQKLIATTEGRLCGRLMRDSFGRIVIQPDRSWNTWLSRTASTLKLATSSALAYLVATPAHAETPAAPKTTSQAASEKSSIRVPPNPPASAPASPPVSPQIQNEEPLVLFMGIICEKPKPPVRKKYKK
jgi:hypothetical protein